MPRSPTLEDVLEALRANTAATERSAATVQALTQAIHALAEESRTHTEVLRAIQEDGQAIQALLEKAAKPSGPSPLHDILRDLVAKVEEGNGLLRQVLAARPAGGNGQTSGWA